MCIEKPCVQFFCVELPHEDLLTYWQPDTAWYAGKGKRQRLAGPALRGYTAKGPERFGELDAAMISWGLPSAQVGPECFFYATFEEHALEQTAFACSHMALPQWQIQQDAHSTKLWVSFLGEAPGRQALLKRFQPQPLRSVDSLFAQGLVLPEDTSFSAVVTQALEHLAPDQKVVLSRQVVLPGPETWDLANSLRRLRDLHSQATTFALVHPRGEVFFGATPESLMHLQSEGPSVVADTEALGGSAPPGDQAGQALLADPKEGFEHALIVEHLLGALQGLGLDAQAPPAPELLKLAHIQHLRTPIKARCPASMRLLDLVNACFPTPAICGTPPPEARRLISALEAHPRGLYTGVLGWQATHGHGSAYVPLRCATWRPGSVRLYAGAGIVSRSIPAREAQEVQRKLCSLFGL